MVRRKQNSILHANIFYLFIGILLIFVGSIVQAREIYSGLLITEYILILIPSIIYIKIKGLSLKETLKLNKISPKQILYVFGISIFAYPIAVFLNLIVISILTLFGELSQSAAPIADNPTIYMFSLFVISITPAICEEVMFRGVMMNAYENISKRKAIIYSAILFGVFHINIQNLVGPLLLGIIFGITVYKTNSIYASMIGHAFNNAIALTIGYFATKAQGLLPEGNEIELTAVDTPLFEIQMIISIMVIGALALVSFIILKKLIKGLPKGEDGEVVSFRKTDEIQETNGSISSNTNQLSYIPIAVFFVIFVYINLRFTFI